MARNANRLIGPAFLLALVTAITACSSPEIIRETPQPSATATATLVPVETAVVPTSTVSLGAPSRRIERIALATEVDEDGAPEDERAVISEKAEQVYLCVQVSGVEQGSRFRAIWYEGDDVIGRSEKVALEDAGGSVWMSLFFRPIAKLNPARDHAVELIVDDRMIERLVFRVGVGDAADVIAAAGFTTGFDTLGKAINPQTRFHVDTPKLTLRVRISNQVDPTGMIFSTLWYRGDTQIHQQAPDPKPAGQATPTADARRLTFTYEPSSRLTPGSYRVALLLNGTEVRSISFVITEEIVPTPIPSPTGTPRGPVPTASPLA